MAAQLAYQRESGGQSSRSDRMSAGLARNWWAFGLRSVLALVFTVAILLLPRPTLAALVLTFAIYLAADGAMAIVAAIRAMRRGEMWQTLIFEGAINLSVAGVVLIWPAIAAVPFVRLTSGWAIATGVLLISAARRLPLPHGRWLLVLAGLASVAWGVLVATWGPADESPPEITAWWLIGYALPFAAILLILTAVLQRRHRQSSSIRATA